MNKIIAAFDSLSFSASTQDAALHLAKELKAHLVGVFLDDVTRHSYHMADLTKYEGSFDEHLETLNHQDARKRDEAVLGFEHVCEQAGVSYSVHRDRNIALQELLHESVYCDLIIIDEKETLTPYHEEPPTRFMRDLLSEVQCPVLIVPSTYTPFDSVTILYDGEPSSVHAVKMFNYLLAPFVELPTEVVSVKNDDDSVHLPDHRLMKEFLKRHCPHAQNVILKGRPEDQIISYLGHEKKHPMVVLGAYRRGRMSRLFRPSMADILMNHLNLPLFIAHGK